jgi:hypothetical protein
VPSIGESSAFFKRVKKSRLAHSLAEMADDVGAEPDMTEHRKPRDHEIEGVTVKDGDKNIGETSSSHGSKAKKVQSGQKEEEKKPSKLKETWGKLGLDMGTVLMMFKYVWGTDIEHFG